MDITTKDGITLRGIPDGTPDEVIKARIEQIRGGPAPKFDSAADSHSRVADVGKGLLSGAADIGNTIINAASFPARKLSEAAGFPQLEEMNQNRNDSLDSFNEDNKSTPFSLGRFTSNVAGTAGAGNVLANVTRAISSAPAALRVAQAMETGGMAKVGMPSRVAGGAITGGVSAGMIDPESAGEGALMGGAVPLVAKALTAAGKGVADLAGEIGTHTGGEGIKQAAKAGLEGGATAKTFADNMRGNVPMADVLDDAKANLAQMGKTKAAEYRAGMAQVSGDKSILSFNGIDKAVSDASQIGSFKGQNLNKKAGTALQEITDEVANWKNLNPAEYHTPEGLDALKKKIGGILEDIPYENKTARLAADKVYKSIKDEIAAQAPVYAKTMKGYSEASEQITEIEKALSLGDKASVDSGMRKLQSLTRNNANTNYGNRLEMAKALTEQGGREIMPALAGQSLSAIAPRGLGKTVAGLTAAGGLATMNPAAIPLLAVQSPRLVGETALKVGQTARHLRKTTPAVGAVAAAMNRD
jgi:hypothetical protein